VGGLSYEELISAAAELLRQGGRNFALTGAGVSTESGIPDFRSPGTGLWERYDPMKTATLSALRRDPAAFYDWNLQRWEAVAGAEPNPAHTALARMEELGFLAGLITQNIDGLHLKAGSKSLFEIHGHLRTCRCMSCERHFPFSHVTDQYGAGINPPHCACGGVLRPDVVLFEDRMSPDFFRATQALSGCQVLVVAGTSLQVYPAAGLLDLARRVVIINREPVPGSERADLVIHGPAGRILSDLARVCAG
jgi:NAD-dependent deacetylase